MNIIEKKKKIIGYFMEKSSLMSPELLPALDDELVCEKAFNLIENNASIDSVEAFLKNTDKKIHITATQTISKTPTINHSFKILHDFYAEAKKREVKDFVSYFAARYRQIESLLKQRKELSTVLSIGRLQGKKDREQLAVVAMINKKEITRNGNIIFSVEDLTGETKVLVNKNNPELFSLAQEIVPDEVVGIAGVNGDNIIFANNIIQPDVMLDKEFRKYSQDQYVVFLSDLHVGSKDFLEEELLKFINWINGDTGSDKQRNIAQKVSHIIIAGDLVDGVGIYPGQEEELDITDISDQYTRAAEYLEKIPKHIPIIICPGNHDAVRLSEPQPHLPIKYAPKLYEMENIHLVSNPSLVNIAGSDIFPGFDVLIYHGYSFDYYVANVDSIRQQGGYDRADLIMKFMLKRRHVAPTYKSSLFIPDHFDSLVIQEVPDFFITGHIHKTAVSTYRNTTLICGSCWQKTTSFQEKVGHHPEPARVPVVNLKTRKVTILNFTK